MSQYVDQGILKEFHTDTGSTSYAERISFGSTGTFTIRSSGVISTVGTTVTTSTASGDFVTPPWAKGVEIYAAVTAVASGTSGIGLLTFAVQPKSPFSADYLGGSSWLAGNMTGSTAVFSGATGDVYLTIYPGVTAVAGGSVPVFNAVFPQTFRVLTTFAGTSNSWTYGVTGRFVP